MSETVRVEISAIAAGGEGVGRTPDGRAVFVHRTVPGETVRAEVLTAKRRWARAKLDTVLEPAPDRREPPCAFYARCGGCTLEHMEYAAQLSAKAGIVAAALRRIGRLDIEPPDVVPSPAELRYRNRLSFTLARLPGGRVVAGFHELHRPGRILDIDDRCLMPEPAVARTWAGLRATWGRTASRLPSGPELRLTIRAVASGRTALLVQGGYGPGRADELLPRVPELDAVWHQPSPDRETTLLAGTPHLVEDWHGEEIRLAGGVFLQVNRAAAALLEAHVLTLAGDVAGSHVVDAYCGVGLHAARLAARGARVTAIELDADAVREGRRRAPDVRFIRDRVESALPAALPADIVIVNPPRTGLGEDVVDVLRARPPARLIYVSCDPATLARDVQRLDPVFRMRSIRCFDLFPQTSHVETVLEMSCSTM
jgi:23S rRNA (uracil1939-C5)-methyltransferase